MTTHECFVQAQQIEQLAAEFYARLASLFEEDSPHHEEFVRLSEEEIQHEARLRILDRQHSANHSLFTNVKSLEGELETTHETAVQMLDMLAEVSRGDRVLDLETTYQRLIAFEEQLAHLHAEKMARAADPAICKFFKELAKQDLGHTALLRRAHGTAAVQSTAS